MNWKYSIPHGKNVALASRGTKATASGSAPVSDNHKLEHINDGQYGNAHSWMSSEIGGGWVELTFDQPRTIERVVWGRDRDEKYKDRLAIEYSIEMDVQSETHQVIATFADRQSFADNQKPPTEISSFGLTDKESESAQDLLNERISLEKEIASAVESQKVFAGNFVTPPPTQLLSRGDPEQPIEEVSPAVIAALGDVSLSSAADEQERRSALANWIADPGNPLTARVMANRIWQWHFGMGLVETS